MKVCTKCKETKPFESFHKRNVSKDGRQSRCKECNNETVRKWQTDNPDKFEGNWRKQYGNPRRRATKYGLTVEELGELLENSNGVCTICGRLPNKWLVIDHCHNTNIVRGILCEKCNQSLGLMDDNIEYLKNAINYLEKSRSNNKEV